MNQLEQRSLPELQEIPQFTLYRDGLANLNGEASRVLLFETKAEAVQLLAPAGPGCPTWLLLAPPLGSGLSHTLYGRADRTRYLRFRSRELATAVFALLPAEQPTLRLQLAPVTAGRFRLIPLS